MGFGACFLCVFYVATARLLSDDLLLIQTVHNLEVDNAETTSTLSFEQQLDGERLTKAVVVRLPERQPPRVATLQRLQWLHVPKCGTSFFSTIWGYACGQVRLLDLAVDPKAAPKCLPCYDFALMDRYPKEVCSPDILDPTFQTQHKPTSLINMQAGQKVVGFFREPSQRLISAARAMHTNGFPREANEAIWAECRGNASCFARYPGVAGCATRMLTGQLCADEAGGDGLDRVPDALVALDAMTFVGLTEEWDESVCLFHVMFGGSIYGQEFLDIHTSRTNDETYDFELLGGFRDMADEQIYAAARAKFFALRQEHVGEGSACQLALGTESPTEAGERQAEEAPKSCANEQLQCGQSEEKDCGRCPPLRLRFVDDSPTGAPTCSEQGICTGTTTGSIYEWYFTA